MAEDKELTQAQARKRKAHEAYMQSVRDEAKILSSELELPSKALLKLMVKAEIKNYFNEFVIDGMVYNIRLARKKSQPAKTEPKK